MTGIDLDALSNRELLRLHCTLMDTLRHRQVVRSSNNPVADYAESLVAQALGLSLEANSHAGYDATGVDGLRYQIKGRRLTAANGSTQLGALRNLDSAPFDQLAAVIFDAHLDVRYAALIPLATVRQIGKYQSHTHSHTVHFRYATLALDGVRDITATLRLAAQAM
jgi:hypothetical protein